MNLIKLMFAKQIAKAVEDERRELKTKRAEAEQLYAQRHSQLMAFWGDEEKLENERATFEAEKAAWNVSKAEQTILGMKEIFGPKFGEKP